MTKDNLRHDLTKTEFELEHIEELINNFYKFKKQDERLIKFLKEKKHLLVLSKELLENAINDTDEKDFFGVDELKMMSLGMHIEELKKRISTLKLKKQLNDDEKRELEWSCTNIETQEKMWTKLSEQCN